MTNQVQHAEHKDKTSPQRRPAKPVRQGPVAPAPQSDALSLQRAIADPSQARPADILTLQRTAGNRAVTRLIQAKLTVGPAGDRYEQEADRVADQVMSMQLPSPAGRRAGGEVQRQPVEEEEIQTKPLAASITPLVQRQPVEEEEIQAKSLVQRQPVEEEEIQTKSLVQRAPEEEEEIQTKSLVQRAPEEEEEVQTKSVVQRRADGGFEAGPEIESRLAALKGSGSPLSDDVRAAMEPRFGVDFGGVRIHTGGEADHLNRKLSAEAFTHGQDIYMRAGRYAPGTPGGNRLLAHELAHTVQQGAGRRIARWEFGGHKAITTDVLDKPFFSRNFSPTAKETLAMKSAAMDARAKNITSFVGGKFLVGPIMGLIKMKGAFPRIPSELLNHGEEGGYQRRNDGSQDAAHVRQLTADAAAAMHGNNPNTALGILGDAIHAAEDRGSHGDGNPGTGHDPKCLIPDNVWPTWVRNSVWKNEPEANSPTNPFFRGLDWYPDSFTLNSEGHDRARDVFGPRVLHDFFNQISPQEVALLRNFGQTTQHSIGKWAKSIGHFFGVGH